MTATREPPPCYRCARMHRGYCSRPGAYTCLRMERKHGECGPTGRYFQPKDCRVGSNSDQTRIKLTSPRLREGMTKRYATFVCSFSEGLDDLSRRRQRNPETVLAILRRTRRFSVFEATATEEIAHTLDGLQQSGRITTDHSCGYPWIRVTHIDGKPLESTDHG
jgi:hypothetical protein